MKKLKIPKIIGKSFDRTLEILFRPFAIKKWCFLILIASLAGALGGGGNPSGGGPTNSPSDQATQNTQKASVISDEKVKERLIEFQEKERGKKENRKEQDSSSAGDDSDSFIRKTKQTPLLMIILFSLLVMLLFALMLLMMWLSARFKFIWYNSIVENDASIAAPFSKYKVEGNSIFKLSLVLSGVLIGVMAMTVSSAVILGKLAGAFAKGFPWSASLFFQIFAGPILLAVFAFIIFGIFSVLVEDFVVVIMAIDRSKFMKALSSFVEIYKEHTKDIWIYILIKIGLSVALGFLALAVFIMWLIAFIIIGLIVFGIPFLIFGLLLKLKILFAISAILLAIPFLILMVLSSMAISLPFAVFHKNFSLFYFSNIQDKYMPLELSAEE